MPFTDGLVLNIYTSYFFVSILASENSIITLKPTEECLEYVCINIL